MEMGVDVLLRWIDYWLDRQRTMAIVAVLSQFKLFTGKGCNPILAFITHLDALEHVDSVGCILGRRWGGGRLSLEAKVVCVCIL